MYALLWVYFCWHAGSTPDVLASQIPKSRNTALSDSSVRSAAKREGNCLTETRKWKSRLTSCLQIIVGPEGATKCFSCCNDSEEALYRAMYISNHTTRTTMTSWSFESNDICQVHLGEWNALRGNQSSVMLSISTLHKLLADQSLSCAESPKHVCTTLAIIGGQLGADPDWHVTSIHDILLLERLIVSFVLSSWNESSLYSSYLVCFIWYTLGGFKWQNSFAIILKLEMTKLTQGKYWSCWLVVIRGAQIFQ